MFRVVFQRASFAMLAMLVILTAPPLAAQESPQATDVTSAQIQKFINALPRDRVSDRAIRTVEVIGDYRVGVYGVFRPRSGDVGHGGLADRLYPRAHRQQSTGLGNRGRCFPSGHQGGRHHHPRPHAALVQRTRDRRRVSDLQA